MTFKRWQTALAYFMGVCVVGVLLARFGFDTTSLPAIVTVIGIGIALAVWDNKRKP